MDARKNLKEKKTLVYEEVKELRVHRKCHHLWNLKGKDRKPILKLEKTESSIKL